MYLYIHIYIHICICRVEGRRPVMEFMEVMEDIERRRIPRCAAERNCCTLCEKEALEFSEM